MSKPGRPVDQTIRAGLSELGIRVSDENSWEAFYSLIISNRNSGGKEKFIERWTMNDCSARVLVISIAVMIVCVYRDRRAVMGLGWKWNLLAILPRRCNAGEKHQKRTSDEQQAFHDGLLKTLPYDACFFKRDDLGARA
jgi:hypothetical protein